MAAATKMKTRARDDGTTEILVLVNHPMETGQRVDAKTKEKVPAHFIQTMAIEHNGKVIATIEMAQGISKDPLIGVAVAGAKAGDKVACKWTDSKNEAGGADAAVA
jgi:sulfur-oxidizing protein SoxZ